MVILFLLKDIRSYGEEKKNIVARSSVEVKFLW